MKRVGLSIDFDFWVREDPMWDFGHSEAGDIFMTAAWSARYLHIDLVKECDIRKHADFLPTDLWDELLPRGLWLDDMTPCAIAESHVEGYNWFKNAKVDRIIHLDAHHDAWEYDPKRNNLDCGNWLAALPHDATWLYPKWKDPENDPKPTKPNMTVMPWADFEIPPSEKAVIDRIFVCRSGVWVPPHLDDEFGKFVEMLAATTAPKQIGCMIQRPDVDHKKIAKARKDFQAWQAKARKALDQGLK